MRAQEGEKFSHRRRRSSASWTDSASLTENIVFAADQLICYEVEKWKRQLAVHYETESRLARLLRRLGPLTCAGSGFFTPSFSTSSSPSSLASPPCSSSLTSRSSSSESESALRALPLPVDLPFFEGDDLLPEAAERFFLKHEGVGYQLAALKLMRSEHEERRAHPPPTAGALTPTFGFFFSMRAARAASPSRSAFVNAL